jgi:kexin
MTIDGFADYLIAAGSTATEAADEAGSTDQAGFLPSFLPTFGVSAKTQAWIYGSFIVISAFIAAVAVYLVKQRRKQKAREDGMNYEFEALNNDDLEEGTPRSQGQTGGAVGGRRKARDLYDAFGASDDESQLFSDDDDDADQEKEDYDDEAARGLDESPRGEDGAHEKLLGRGNRS